MKRTSIESLGLPIRTMRNGLEDFGVPGLYGDPEEQVFYLDVRELARSKGEPEDDDSLRALAVSAVAELERRMPGCWPIRILEDGGA